MKQQTKQLPQGWKEENCAEVEIFFDEIEPEKECNYLILGALFMHSQDKAKVIETLLNLRCQNSKKESWDSEYFLCKNKDNCKELWHNLNNVEVHFNEIREGRSSKSQIEISKGWLNFFINQNQFHASILSIDLSKLDTSFFGDRSVNVNIYNKFFRTLLNYGLKCFFVNYNKINIKNIFYDKKEELERHSFFNNFNFDKLVYETEDNITLLGKIIFIDSDHKIEKIHRQESHLIQMTDLILGVVRQNIFYASKDRLKCEVSRILRPQLNKLKNKYWSLKYFKISFFPKKEIKSVLDLQNNQTYERHDEFYSLGALKLKMPAQETNLGKWFQNDTTNTK